MRPTAPALALLLLVGSLSAGEDDLDRAKRLRDEATEAWKSDEHAGAAEKLREADRIYAAEEGATLEDRAITLRALAWNESKLALANETRRTWFRLIALCEGRREVWDEVWSGYGAVLEVARGMEQVDASVEYLGPVRRKARELGYPKIAAQTHHDLGSICRKRGLSKQAISHYEKAIEERYALGDHLGRAWSLNNIANLHVVEGRSAEALAPLLAAYRVVHTEEVIEPQAAVAWNLNAVLDDLDALTDPADRKAFRAWLWRLVECATKTKTPKIVPPDRLLREILALEPTKSTAGKVMRQKLGDVPPEVTADLAIRASRAAGGKKALGWLSDLEVGDGPAAAHLEARRRTVLATAAAETGKRGRFLEEAKAAASAFRALEDLAGREGALGRIVAAAKGRDWTKEIADLAGEYDELRMSGKPGGMGGMATSSGDGSAAKALALDDPLFAITLETDPEKGRRILVRDLAARREQRLAMDWRPRSLSLNGLALRTFGGYVTVHALNYGGSATTPGNPGTITLDELGSYLPVPAEGRLVILKNGAIRYELR